MVVRCRKIATMPEDIREDAIAAFPLQFGDVVLEDVAVRERHRFCSPALNGFLYDRKQGA
jgi:hypothetical protein